MRQTWRHKNRKHSAFACFRKNQKRSILRTEEIGELKTEEHTSESRNNHQFAAVVPVLATQCNPCQTKTSQETEEFTKVSRAVAEAKSYSYVQISRIWQVLCRIIMELSNNNTSSIRNKRNCRTSCTSNERRDISRIYCNLVWMMSGDRIL